MEGRDLIDPWSPSRGTFQSCVVPSCSASSLKWRGARGWVGLLLFKLITRVKTVRLSFSLPPVSQEGEGGEAREEVKGEGSWREKA